MKKKLKKNFAQPNLPIWQLGPTKPTGQLKFDELLNCWVVADESVDNDDVSNEVSWLVEVVEIVVVLVVVVVGSGLL